MAENKIWIVEKSVIGLYNLIRKERGKPDFIIAQNVSVEKAVEMLEKDAYGNEKP